MDIIEIAKQNPEISIVLFAVGISFLTLIITKYVTDQKKMKEMKERQKVLRDDMKKFSQDVKKMAEIQKEMMEMSLDMMKHSFKPMLITFIPLLLFFFWIRDTFQGVLPSWFWYYFIASIVSSLILRKVLDIA